MVSRFSADEITAKLEEFDFLMAKQDKKVSKSPPGYLITSIHDRYAVPQGFLPKAELEHRAEAKWQREEDAAALRRHQREQKAAEQVKRDAINAYRGSLTPDQLAEHEAAAIDHASEEMRMSYQENHDRTFRRMMLRNLLDGYIGHLLQQAAESA